MTCRFGVVMDPIERIHFHKDTTIALLLAAQARGCDLWYMEQDDLYAHGGEAHARMAPLEVFDDPEHWFARGKAVDRPLAELNVILMRKDPPVNRSFIYSAMLLELAERAGVTVANRPRALCDHNEKLFILQFPDLLAPTLVSATPTRLRGFIESQGDAIIKPLDGMGGSSIFRVSGGDPNLNVILETLTRNGIRQAMAQRYLPEISEGDKRVLLIDGEPVPFGLARIPAANEHRGNLAAGGRGKAFALGAAEHAIAAQVGPVLVREGARFAGLDIIGDRLTEINITSPTCVREIERAHPETRIAERLIDTLLCRGAD